MGEYPEKHYILQTIHLSLLIKELLWNSEATFFKLSLCAFLQDLTLRTLNLIKIKDYKEFLSFKDQLSDDEIKNFLDHPLRAKELVSGIEGLPPDVDKIVFEQLELPGGDG